MLTDLLKPLVPFYDVPYPIDWNKEFNRCAPLEVEIGFGLGEVLLGLSKKYPDRNFFGIEEHWERTFRTLKKVAVIPNIRILFLDARVALEKLFQQETIEQIYCLFPCPWPKKGHVKHRLFSMDFLKLVNSRLKNRGRLTIVTDAEKYRQWIEEQISDTGFQYEIEKIAPRYDTKFERKWLQKGQKEFFELRLIKVSSIDIPFKENAPLQSYRLKNFNPQRFYFDKDISEVSVIFKEILFDEIKQKASVRIVVEEGRLIQHFRIAIKKKEEEDFWRVSKEDGQNFFPTPGIAKAIEIVYQKALESMS